MAYKATQSTPATPVAALLTNEQSARKFANAVAETLDADEIAVGLVDAGRGRWRVTVYFGAPPDRRTLRELAVAAAGPQAGTALRPPWLTPLKWHSSEPTPSRPAPMTRNA